MLFYRANLDSPLNIQETRSKPVRPKTAAARFAATKNAAKKTGSINDTPSLPSSLCDQQYVNSSFHTAIANQIGILNNTLITCYSDYSELARNFTSLQTNVSSLIQDNILLDTECQKKTLLYEQNINQYMDKQQILIQEIISVQKDKTVIQSHINDLNTTRQLCYANYTQLKNSVQSIRETANVQITLLNHTLKECQDQNLTHQHNITAEKMRYDLLRQHCDSLQTDFDNMTTYIHQAENQVKKLNECQIQVLTYQHNITAEKMRYDLLRQHFDSLQTDNITTYIHRVDILQEQVSILVSNNTILENHVKKLHEECTTNVPYNNTTYKNQNALQYCRSQFSDCRYRFKSSDKKLANCTRDLASTSARIKTIRVKLSNSNISKKKIKQRLTQAKLNESLCIENLNNTSILLSTSRKNNINIVQNIAKLKKNVYASRKHQRTFT